MAEPKLKTRVLEAIGTNLRFIFYVAIGVFFVLVACAIYFPVHSHQMADEFGDVRRDHRHLHRNVHQVLNETLENQMLLNHIKYKLWQTYWMTILIKDDTDYIRDYTRREDPGCPTHADPQCSVGASTNGWCDGELYHRPTEQCESACHEPASSPSEIHRCDGKGHCSSTAPCLGSNKFLPEECPELGYGLTEYVANTTLVAPSTGNCVYFYTNLIDYVSKLPCLERDLWRDRCRGMLTGPLASCMEVEVMCVDGEMADQVYDLIGANDPGFGLLGLGGYVKNKTSCNKCELERENWYVSCFNSSASSCSIVNSEDNKSLICEDATAASCFIAEESSCSCYEEADIDTEIFFGCVASFGCDSDVQRPLLMAPPPPQQNLRDLKSGNFHSITTSIKDAVKDFGKRMHF